MSNFSVSIYKIKDNVFEHPNADRLSIVKIGGYDCISQKNIDGTPYYNNGDSVLYVPEDAIVPEFMLRQGFWNNEKNIGILSGKDNNRVRAIKLRGVVSQGILFPINNNHVCGIDISGLDDLTITETLGITKYIPKIPTSFEGEVYYNSKVNPTRFDFESYEKDIYLFDLKEEVTVSEKIHGTFMQFGFLKEPIDDEHMFYADRAFITSKGIGNRGICFKNVENAKNAYIRKFKELEDLGIIGHIDQLTRGHDVHIMGELFGNGVQDLTYGLKTHDFRVFDIKIDGKYLLHNEKDGEFFHIVNYFKLNPVPYLYSGKFDFDHFKILRDSKSVLCHTQIKEGIVIRNINSNVRKIAKMVSPNYLFRKNSGNEWQ